MASDVSIGLSTGFSSLNVTAGGTSGFSGDGGTGLELRPQVNFEIRSLNTAIDVYYQGRLGSDIGSFPLNRLGTGALYYPMGFAIQNIVADNGVTIQQNHFAPFLLLNLEFASVAVSTTPGTGGSSSTSSVNFNGLAIGYQFGAGGEIPVGQTWSFVAQAFIEGTLAGGGSGSTSSSSGSSSSSSLTSGLTFSTFDFLLGFACHL